jgi:hypothetical protein
MSCPSGYHEQWSAQNFSSALPEGCALVPSSSFANAETVDRLTEQLVWFLKAFHEEQQKSGSSRETEFWRGNFVGMKRAVFAIYGETVKDDVLERPRQTTNLPIPHRGPLSSTGIPEGFDSDADPWASGS